MNQLQVFQYQGFAVDFEVINGQVYANATAMCKPFAKRPNDWYVLPITQRYIQAITGKSGNSDYQLFIKKAGNPEYGGGTWIHEKLILKLAQWLDVDFEIWCDEQIAQLMSQKHLIAPTPSYQIEDKIKRAEQWIREEREREALRIENAEMKPKADYTELVLKSESTLTTTKIAQELGLTAIRLNRILKDKGIQYKRSGIWNLTTHYVGRGYVRLSTFEHTGTDGTLRTEHNLVWTEAGRQFIHRLINPQLAESKAPASLIAA